MAPKHSLYEVLGLERGVSQADIRKAYLRLAVQLHPDKNPNDETAKERFQTLNSVYAVLGNEERRKLYDETGIAQDMEHPTSDSSFDDLYSYYRSMYAKVTEEDIDAFEASYRGSEEEKKDVLKYYEQFKGNMDKVFEWVMCSDPARDSHRFADLVLAELRSKGTLPTKKFTTWEREVRKRKVPKNPLALRKKGRKGKENRGEDSAALVALIRNKQDRAKGGSFLDSLAAKYGVPSSGQAPPEPSDEAFEATAKRYKAGASKSKSKA